MKKLTLLLLSIFSFTSLFAQTSIGDRADAALRSSDKIYVVVSVIAIVFIGLAIFLFSIDRRLRKIEKEK